MRVALAPNSPNDLQIARSRCARMRMRSTWRSDLHRAWPSRPCDAGDDALDNGSRRCCCWPGSCEALRRRAGSWSRCWSRGLCTPSIRRELRNLSSGSIAAGQHRLGADGRAADRRRAPACGEWTVHSRGGGLDTASLRPGRYRAVCAGADATPTATPDASTSPTRSSAIRSRRRATAVRRGVRRQTRR